MLAGMAESSEGMPVASAVKKQPAWIRPIVIWMVNISMFVFIYTLFVGRPTAAGVLATIGVGLAIFIVATGIGTIFTLRRFRREQVDINNAVAAISRGQLDLANETLTRCSQSTHTILSALARHNLGWTLMRQGRLKAAVAVVSNNDSAHEHALKRLFLYGTSSIDLALCFALLGELEDAASWLNVTAQRAALASDPCLPAMTVFVRAVLDCRHERCEDAARLLDEQWPQCEALLKGSELRPLRVLRAYAHAAGGPRNAGVAESLLDSSRPVYDGEFDFLGAAWPAMRLFLISHRLVREPAAPAA
jgi:hypothetical protein